MKTIVKTDMSMNIKKKKKKLNTSQFVVVSDCRILLKKKFFQSEILHIIRIEFYC